jgi:hypothetical protein
MEKLRRVVVESNAKHEKRDVEKDKLNVGIILVYNLESILIATHMKK